MAAPIVIQPGDRFHFLTVIERVPFKSANGKNRTCFRCVCICGKSVNVLRHNLLNENTKSCGCYSRYSSGHTLSQGQQNRRIVHNASGTRLYSCWKSMKWRCNNPKGTKYKDYGGRGITVCPEWSNSFSAFQSWALSNGYSDSLTLDRIDVNGHYCPENCRWAGVYTQAQNRQNTRKYKAFGQLKTITQWASDPICVVSNRCLENRVRHKWPMELALTVKPSRKKLKTIMKEAGYLV